MKATIVGIESGAQFTDGEQRVTLKLADADHLYDKLRLPLSKLGLNGAGTGPHLDQEVEVSLTVAKVRK